ncbi:hypothetical protein GC163_20385 [bacterium]|nr:hypothetical protein [bacterium]
MSYELHIKHVESPFLDFEQWQVAVQSTEGVRAAMESADEWDGAAEMNFDGDWIPVFWWSSGKVSFQLGQFPQQVFATALTLAAKTDGQISGDEGEIYTKVEDLFQ